MFLSRRTRTGIATIVSMLVKFQEGPARVHWKQLIQVVRYLSETMKYAVHVSTSYDEMNVVDCSGADWAWKETNRYSKPEYLVAMS